MGKHRPPRKQTKPLKKAPYKQTKPLKKVGSKDLLTSKRLSWLLAALFFIVVNLGPWTTPMVANHMFIKAIWAQVILVILWTLWCWQQRQDTQPLLLSWPRILFLAFFLWGSLTIFWAINPDFFVFKWLMLLSAAIMFYLCLQLQPEDFHRLLIAILVSAFVTAFVAINQLYLNLTKMPQVVVPAATFGNKNMLGQLMILSFPICFYMLLQPKINRVESWFYAISAALLVAILYHTTARGAWLSLGLGIAILAIYFVVDFRQRSKWLFWNRDKTWASIAALAVLLAVVNFDQNREFKPAHKEFFNELGSVATEAQNTDARAMSTRYMIWKAGLNMVADAPIVGHGLGGFFENMLSGYKNQKSLRTFRAHNDYLETWIEFGGVGLLLLLSGLLAVVYCFVSLYRKSQGSQRFLAVAVFAAGASSLFNALFSFPFQLTVPLLTIAIYMAFLIREAERAQTINLIPIKCPHQINQGFLAVSILVTALACFVNLQWWQGYTSINVAVSNKAPIVPYEPNTWIFNQEQVPIMWAIGHSLHKRKKYQKAKSMVSALEKRWPGEYSTTSLLYEINLKTRNYTEAIRLAQIGLTYAPQGLFSFYKHLFKLYLSLDKKDEALALYKKLSSLPLKTLNSNFNSYEYLMLMALKLNLGEAVMNHHYQTLVKEYGTSADTESNIAIYYITNNKRDKAIEHIKRSLKINPNHLNAPILKGYLKNPNLKVEIDY